MAEFASQRPLGWIGFDILPRPEATGRFLGDGGGGFPQPPLPRLLSLSLVEPHEPGGGTACVFLVDLRSEAVLTSVREVLRLPCPFVGHDLFHAIIGLLRLGLPEPHLLWDTRICEQASRLGRDHWRYRVTPAAEVAYRANAIEEADNDSRSQLSLALTCLRHGVDRPIATMSDGLARLDQDDPNAGPCATEQIDAATADAVAASRLYSHQVLAAASGGLLDHLKGVEMPFVATVARMARQGLRIDREKCQAVEEACERHMADLGPRLARHGVTNARSDEQLINLFHRAGLIGLFRHEGGYSFGKDRLALHEHRHEAIPLLLAARRIADLRGVQILNVRFEDSHGRVHPEYRQLGAHTGRLTSVRPNILGLGRIFRPLVVPGPGCGIGEVDWCQVEVGIAAAVYRDPALVEKFNSGDVYAAMAQDYYADELPIEDRALPGLDFKRKHRDLRDRMKTCTLGIIYGLTPRGLAIQLGIGEQEAGVVQDRFMAMFPDLDRARREAAALGSLRGYAATATGLRRHRAASPGRASSWERRWLINHPVQGTAAALFKVAGNRLDRLYRACGARLIVPMHDAFVFEAPAESIGQVGELTRRVMCEVIEEAFPKLRPRAEVNISHPGCWNKEGHADSIERWLRDPSFTL